MALRKILTDDHPSLRKVCRPYNDFTKRLHTLLDDMGETMMEENGVGLAAPQVGILRRACVVLETNVEEGEDEYIIELVNPEIIASDGEQTDLEGCLSFPQKFGYVSRPEHVVVRAQDRDGNFFEVEGFGLTARAFCHEIDHLDGNVFLDKTDHILTEEELKALFEEQNEGSEDSGEAKE